MRLLKQSTSVDVPIGPFLDDTDGKTAETALTLTQPDIRLKKNAANWAQKAAAQTLSHEENGYYELTLDATDTNTLGLLRVAVAESGALPIWEDFMVVTANIFDTYFSTDFFQVDVREMANNVITDAVINSDAEVNIANTVWDALTASHVTAGTFGLAVSSGTSAASVADAVWDELRSGHVSAGSFGEGTKIASAGIPAGAFAASAITRAAFANDSGLASIRSATAQAGAAGTVTFDAGASALTDFYLYQLVYIVSGTGVGQARIIAGYNGSTKVATITPNWITTPDNTSVFTICPSGVISTSAPATPSEVADQVWDEARAGHVASGTFGEGVSVNATERNALADALLNRDMSAVALTNTRSPLNALRFNRNKFSVVGNTLTVYKEDDITVAWTATLSGINALDLDPVG